MDNAAHDNATPSNAALSNAALDSAQPTVGAVIEQIGPRLRRARERRGVSLADLARATDISTSTLSRLETGQRKPSLELLLPLTATLGVGLDEIVAAPRFTGVATSGLPDRAAKDGRVLTPLTRQRGRLRTCTLFVPAHDSQPHLRTHPGSVWLLVLRGRMRLMLHDRNLVLGPGQAAELDCRTPHWFGSTGRGSVEVLSIFGEKGDRIRMRAQLTHN